MRCGPVSRAMSVAAALFVAAPVLAGTGGEAGSIVLPPMRLEDALLALAGRGGRNILFLPDAVRGLRSRAIHARSFEDALRQMMVGRPLAIERLPGGAVRVVPRPAAVVRRRAAPSPPSPAAPPTDVVVKGSNEGGGGFPSSFALATSLSPDEMRQLPDRTVAEVLGRLPGVVTLATSLEGEMGRIDRAARATGDFVAIRGLPGAYAQSRMDGVSLPQTLPYGRGSPLGMATMSVSGSVTLTRILAGRDAGEGTAGVVDIRHLSPFDEKARRWRVDLAVGADEMAARYRQGMMAWSAGLGHGWASRDGRLAVRIDADIAVRPFFSVEQTYQNGNFQLALSDAAGNNPPGVDPARNLLLTSVNAEISRGAYRDYALNASAGYRIGERLTVTARLGWFRRDTRQDVYQIGFHGGRTPDYTTRDPIGDGLFRARSVRGEVHYWFQTNPERDELMLGQIALKRLGPSVDLSARLFGADGRLERPDHIEISFWDPQGTQLSSGVALDRRAGFPVPILSDADRRLIAAPLDFPIHNQGERQRLAMTDRRFGGEATARWHDLGGWLASAEIGVSVLRSRRRRSESHEQLSDTFAAGTTLGESGLVTQIVPRLLPGIYDFPVPLIDDDALVRALAASSVVPNGPDALYTGNATLEEEQAAIHATATIERRALSIRPSLRVQSIWMHGRFWLSGNDGIAMNGVAYGWNLWRRRDTAILPAVAAQWQASAKLTLTAALWRSQTRPADYQIAGSGAATRNAENAPVIERGNSHLRAVDGTNVDLGINWRGPAGATLSVTVFAKWLDHYLYDAGNNYANAGEASSDGIWISEPRNGGTARIAGIEIAARQPLAALGLADWTLGFDAALLDSRVRLGNVVERTQFAPAHSGTIRLDYAGTRLSFDVAWSFTDAYIQEYAGQFGSAATGKMLQGSAYDVWVQPSRQINLGLGYACGPGMIRLTIRNLFDDMVYRSTMGRHSDAIPETVVGGRQFQLRYAVQF